MSGVQVQNNQTRKAPFYERKLHQRTPNNDFYLELGCCIDCDETRKETQITGLLRDIAYKGKWYKCLCNDCRCGPCTWNYDGECQRKFYVFGLAT